MVERRDFTAVSAFDQATDSAADVPVEYFVSPGAGSGLTAFDLDNPQ